MTVKVGSAKMICLGILLSAALLATSCTETIRHIGTPAKLRQHKEFFDLPRHEQHAMFKAYHIEKQFDIYIVAMTMRQPRDTDFAIDIAARGDGAVPFLVKKLRQKNYPGYRDNASTIEDIKEKTIFIFRMMSRHDYYAVKNDEDAIKAIRGEIEGMQISGHQRVSKDYLWEILEAY
jgi:hypothetical protein